MNLRRLRPSPAMVIACFALLIVLGGTGYAAVQALPRNSVTSVQVKDRSLLAKDFKAGQLPRGARGPAGPAGPAGAAGPAGGPPAGRGGRGGRGPRDRLGPQGRPAAAAQVHAGRSSARTAALPRSPAGSRSVRIRAR